MIEKQIKKQTIKRLISWMLILVLIMPNFAFTEEVPELFSVKVVGSDLTTPVSSFSTQISHRTEGGSLNTMTDNVAHLFKVLNAADGEYALYFSSKEEANTDAYSDPFVFYVVGGVATYDKLGQNPITGTIEVHLREGLLLGSVSDATGIITSAGTVSIDQLFPDNHREWIGGFDIKDDGTVYLPKVDGKYEIGVYPYDQYNQDMATQIVEVEGGIITYPLNNRDMHFSKVQLSGQVYEKVGVKVSNYDYGVDIFDANGVYVTSAHGFDDNGTDYYYRVSQLTPGNYSLVLNPGNYYQSRGYVASSSVPFTVDNDGLVTPAIQALTFREASALPVELRNNFVEVVPSNSEYLEVNFELMYSNVATFTDITCELILFEDGTETIISRKPLSVISNNSYGLETRGDGSVQFWAMYNLEGYALISGEQYVLRVTTPKGNLDLNLLATNAMILQGSDYLGTTADGVYHHLGLINPVATPFDVTLYDASNNPCGTGVVNKFKGRDYDYYMLSDVNEGATPLYFGMASYENQNDYSNEFIKNVQSHFSFYEVTSNDTHYSIKLFNNNIAPGSITDLIIKKWVEGNQEVVFSTADSDLDVILPHDELMGGVSVNIPLEAFAGNEWFDFEVHFADGSVMYRGDLFRDASGNLLNYSVLTPSGDPFIGKTLIWCENQTPGANIQYGYDNGTLYVSSVDDGTYAFIFSSDEIDTYSLSEKMVVHVKDGVAYEDSDCTIPVTDPIEVRLSEGLFLGNALDQQGNPSDAIGHISIDRTGDIWSYVGSMEIKPDGSIYVPKVDGEYKVMLFPWQEYEEASLLMDYIFIEVAGDVISGKEDLQLNPTQLQGTVSDQLGNKILNDDYYVEILDENGMHYADAQYQRSNESSQFYKLGGLPEGDYSVLLHPGQPNVELGYMESLPVQFSVNAEGTATPLIANLKLRHINDMPLQLLSNNNAYHNVRGRQFNVNVDLLYTKATSVDDFDSALFVYENGVQVEMIPLLYVVNEDEHLDRRPDHTANYRATFDLGDRCLVDGQTYVLKIHDGTSVVETEVLATSKPIMYFAQYVGSENGKNIHQVAISSNERLTYNATIYDSNDDVVGTGVIRYEDKYDEHIMESTLEVDAKPAYFTVDSNEVYFHSMYSNSYAVELQPYDSLSTISSDATHFYYDLINVALTPDNIHNFELRSWLPDGSAITFPNTAYPDVVMTPLTGGLGGVRIAIPKDAITANRYYSATFDMEDGTRFIRDRFFLDTTQAVLTGRVKDPTGLTAVNDIMVWGGSLSGERSFVYEIYKDQFIIIQAEDGQYELNIFSTGNNTYANADLFTFWVKNGIAYADEANTTPITGEQIVKLRTGVLVGKITPYNNLPPIDTGYLNINHVLPDQTLEWVTSLMAKPSGDVYLPSDWEGKYRLTLNPFDEFMEIVGQRDEVTMLNGESSAVVTLGFHDLQMVGDVLKAVDTSVENFDYTVEIKDSEGKVLLNSFNYTYKAGKYEFKVGGLIEGAYTIQLLPGTYYKDRGYTPSEIYNFTINVDGTSSLTRLDLMLTWFDVEKPILMLAGDKTITIPYGVPFVDPGYMVYDNATPADLIVKTVEGSVNTNIIGTYTLTYKMRDEAGNETIAVRTIHVVDTVLPTVSIQNTAGTVLPESIKVVGDTLNFKVVASDAYDLNNISVNVTMNGTLITGNGNTYSAPLVAGINYLKVVVKDQSGNMVQKTIVIDNFSLSFSANPATLTNQNVTVSALIPNDVYGNVIVGPSVSQVANVNSELIFTAYSEGLTTAKTFKFNVSNIDKTAPATPVLSASSTQLTNQSIYLTMTGSDKLQYQMGSGEWIDYTGAFKVDANVTINARAVDTAGNVTLGNSIAVNWIDKTAPVLTTPPMLTINGVPYTGSEKVKIGDVLSISFSATDNLANLKAYVKLNDQVATVTPFTTGQSINIPVALPSVSASANTIRLWIEDEVGNRIAFSENLTVLEIVQGLKIDVKAPLMTLVGGNITLPVGSTYVDAGVSIYDDMDGTTLVPVVTGTVNTSAVGVYTLTYDVSDKAGNPATQLKRTVTVVDNVKPMIATSLINQTVSKASFSFTAKASDNHQIATFTVTHNGTPVVGNLYNYAVNLIEGENTFVMTAKDPSNNTITTTYKVVFVRPPSGQPIISASTLAPTNQPILVTIDYPAEAFETLYALGSATNWQTYTGEPLSITSSTTVFAVSRQTPQSTLSNVVSLVLDNYDAVAPTEPVISVSKSGITKEDVVVTITGEGTIYYSFDQMIDTEGTLNSYQVYDQPFSVAQNVKVYAVTVDEAANPSEVSMYTINNIDKISPIGTIEYTTTAPTKGSVLATLVVNEPYEMVSGTLRYHEFTTNGTYVFNFTDMAGNTGTVTAEVKNIDKIAPTLISKSVLKQGSVPTIVKGGDLLDISIIVEDVSEVSGKVSLGTVVIDHPLTATPTGKQGEVRLTGQLQIPSNYNGTLDLKAIVKDATGNPITVSLLSGLVIDNIKPVFMVTLSNPVSNGFIKEATLDLNIQNDGSTILYGLSTDLIDQPIDGLETFINNPVFNDGESHTIYLRAIDAAGNTSDVKSLTFKWDSIAPQKPSIHLNVPNLTNTKNVVIDGTAEQGTVVVKRSFTANDQSLTDTIYNGPTALYLQGVSTDLRQGINHFEVVNTDSAGNVSESSVIEVTFDGIAPLLDVTMDELGEITIRTNETLKNVKYLLDGEVQVSPTFENGIAVIEPITEAGDHILLIEGSDNAGNIGIGRLSFITVPGNVTVTKELSDGITMTEGTFTEASQLSIATFEVSAGQDMSFIGEPIKFELSGNSQVSPTNGIIVDVFIGLGYPANTKLHYYNASDDIWEALDASLENGDSIYNDGLSSIYVTVDPSLANAIAVTDVPEGAIEVAPGHLLGFMRHFSGYAAIQDQTPPTLQVLTAEPVLPLSATTISVNVSVSEKSKLTINGIQEVAVKNAGTYNYVLNLVEGENVLTFKATDLAGLNSTTEHFVVERDTAFENLVSNMSGVVNGSTVRNNTLVVNATATDKNFDQIKINDVVYKTTSVTKAVTLVEGDNTIQILATDKAGNSEVQEYTVKLDSVGPVVMINGISEGAIMSGDIAATIAANADLASYSWTLSNSMMTLTGNNQPISYNVPEGSKDNYELTVDGFDTAGNITRVSLSFAVDQAAPTIEFGQVTPVSNQSQTVTVTVSPKDADTEVKLYKDNVRVTNLTIDSITNDALDTEVFTMLVADSGNYEVRVTSVNMTIAASEVLSFKIDKMAPILAISGVAQGQTYVAEPTIVFSSTDPVQATLTKAGSAPVVIGNNYKVMSSGTYTLTVTSTDAAMNTTSQSVNFTVNLPAVVVPPGNGGTPGTGGTPGGSLPTTPVVVDESESEKLVVEIGQKVLNFEDLEVEIQLTKNLMDQGTEVVVKRFEAQDVNATLEMETKNKMVFKLASQIYEFTSSKVYEGEMEITLPFDPTLVTDMNKVTVAWYDEALKTWVPIGGKVDKTNYTITFKTTHFSYYTVLSGSKTFKDLVAYGWAKTAIETLASRGIVNGYDVQNFKPGSEITRAEFATMIVNALSLSKDSGSGSNSLSKFKDVKDEWFRAALEIAESQNIISGYNGYLMPINRITREEMAVMIINAFKLVKNYNETTNVKNLFSDINQMSSWSIQSIALANDLGIIKGKGDNLFAPKSYANRAEAASMIYKLLQVLE